MAEVLHTYPIPPIGAEGVYSLAAPFTTLPKERFKCVDVRRISGYIANNEDPYELVYAPKNLARSIYEEDLKRDLEIVTLLSDRAMRILVPANYIQAYPAQDGISYLRVGLTVHMPPIPLAEAELEPLITRMKEVVESTMGFTSPQVSRFVVKGVSKIPAVDHDTAKAIRDAVIAGRTTDYARSIQLEAALAEANAKVAELEAFILANP